MDGSGSELIVDEILKVNTDDKHCGNDLVDEVVHEAECVDVLTADVYEVAKQNVNVEDVNLSRVFENVGVFLNDVRLLIDIDVVE